MARYLGERRNTATHFNLRYITNIMAAFPKKWKVSSDATCINVGACFGQLEYQHLLKNTNPSSQWHFVTHVNKFRLCNAAYTVSVSWLIKTHWPNIVNEGITDTFFAVIKFIGGLEGYKTVLRICVFIRRSNVTNIIRVIKWRKWNGWGMWHLKGIEGIGGETWTKETGWRTKI